MFKETCMKHLTKEEQLKLFFEAKGGDTKALQLLIESNLNLYRKVAKELGYKHRGGQNIEDLLHEGIIGVYRSFEKYDPRLGTSWSTYSSDGAKKRMLNALTKDKVVSGLSSNATDRTTLFMNLKDRSMRDIKNTLKEKGYKFVKERVKRHRMALTPVSIDSTPLEGESSLSTPPKARDMFLEERVQKRIRNVKFTDRERFLLNNLMAEERLSQVDISVQWKCSRQYVAQQEARLKSLLKPLLADLA